MPRKPSYVTKRDLAEHKKEIKKLLRDFKKQDKKEDDRKYQQKRKKHAET